MSSRAAIPRRDLLRRVAAVVLLGVAVYKFLPGLTDGLVYLLPALLLSYSQHHVIGGSERSSTSFAPP